MKDTEHSQTPDVSHIKNIDVTHEQSDVNVSMILKFGAGLFVSTVVIYVLMLLLFDVLKKREDALEPKRSPMAFGERQLPPEPRLQLAPGHDRSPREEMQQLRDKEDKALNSYGWVDQNAGTVRIPIELAKKLVLERGLPARSEQPRGGTRQ